MPVGESRVAREIGSTGCGVHQRRAAGVSLPAPAIGCLRFASELGAGECFPFRSLIHEFAAFDGSIASAGQPVRIPHDGVRSQHAEASFVGRQLFVQALLLRLVTGDAGARLVEFRLCGVDVTTGVVEIGLRLSQGSRAAPGGDLGVAPIAGPERSDRFAHGLDLFQVAPDVSEFAHGFGDILEGGTIERPQRVGQRFRESPFVGILG